MRMQKRSVVLIAILTLALLVTGTTSYAQRSGGTVVLPVLNDPGPMNPLLATATVEVILTRIMFNGLARFNPENFTPEPFLAKNWYVSEDGLEWTFELRDDVQWHDGHPFTADDVKFSMDTIRDPRSTSTAGRNLTNIQETEVVDAHTVKFILDRPFPALPVYLASRFQVAPKHLLEGRDLASYSQFNRVKPIGTGAFMMEEYVPGEYISLVANPNFFLGRPHLDRVIFKIVPDQNSQIAQLKSGELHAMELEPYNVPAVQGDRNIRLETGYKSKWWSLHLNHNFPLFQDKRVRQAIAYSIDRDELVASVLHGLGRPAGSPIDPVIDWAHNPETTPYEYDPEKAKELLRQAGWELGSDGIWQKDGEKLSFLLQMRRGHPTAEQATAIVHQRLRAVGMDVQIRAYESGAFVTEVRDARDGPNMSQAYITWMTPEPEPDGIFGYFHSSQAEVGSNFTAYRNDEVDRLLEFGRSALDAEERVAAYMEVQELLKDEVARAFLFYPQIIFAVSNNLDGIKVTEPYQYIEEWHLR